MKTTQPHLVLALLAAAWLSGPLMADTKTIQLSVSSGSVERENVPVRVTVRLPDSLAEGSAVTLADEDGNQLAGQITRPSLLSESKNADDRELHFILPKLAAGKTLMLTATISDQPSSSAAFVWTETKDKYADLNFGTRPVLRYVCELLDESTPERREETYKVYHHVYDPAGKQLVTKGAGGRYTHHRGVFYGFNKVNYVTEDGKAHSCDIWHCKGAHQAHIETIATEQGPVLGRHSIAIGWHGPDKGMFAREEREITAYNAPGGTLIEFASRLQPNVEHIKLDGDPQHAGFHFRASDEVASKTSKQTYYLRPDGQGKPGETRNWPGDKDHVNLPWNAMSFVIGDQRYTCCYLDRPENPKEARFSERDYGRFGSYFEYELTGDETLDLNYRLWLQGGEMNIDDVKSLSREFVTPVSVEIKGS